MKTVAIVAASVLASIVSTCAGDWPQWRGPNRDGISKETGLLKQWPDGGPKLLWRQKDLGGGYSTPAIVGERLFVMGSEGMTNEFAEARGTRDGARIWSTRVGAVGKNEGPNYPGSRSTPTVDGELIYALASDGDLACLETATGRTRWTKSLRKDFGGQPGNWAYAESPLVDGDVMVCTPGGATATIVALNKKSGGMVWKCALPGGDQAGYASLIIAEIAGVRQYIAFVQKALVGVDAKTGKLLWSYERTAKGSPANIPTPVEDQDYVFSGAGRTAGAIIKVNQTGEAWRPQEIQFTPKLPTAIGGAVKVGEALYGTTGQGLVCADFKTGEIKWQERAIGAASLCYADGRLYLHGENGEVGLVEPSVEGYREKGRFTPPEPPRRINNMEKAWAYPVVANGRLYIRDTSSLWCYDVRSK